MTMTTTPASRAWLLVLFLGATAPSIAAAQVLPLELESDEIKADLREYREFILDYRRERGDAVERILPWEKKRIARLLASIGTARDEVRLWGIARFKAAAMMHTDAALRLIARSEIENALLHIDTASQLLKKAGRELDVYAGAGVTRSHGSCVLPTSSPQRSGFSNWPAGGGLASRPFCTRAALCRNCWQATPRCRSSATCQLSEGSLRVLRWTLPNRRSHSRGMTSTS